MTTLALLAAGLALAGFWTTALARELVSGRVRLALSRPFSCDLCSSFWFVLVPADAAWSWIGLDGMLVAAALVPACGLCLLLLKVRAAIEPAEAALQVALPEDPRQNTSRAEAP